MVVSGTVAIALTAPVALAPLASADTLSSDETSRLSQGDTVVRNTTLDGDDYRYVGGVSYTILETTPDELATMLEDVATYRAVLPRTQAARKVETRGEDTFVELTQGTSIFQTSYTIRIRKDPAESTVRFWLDTTRPHGIDDAWGFFRYATLGDGRVLLTFGVLVDVGPGVVRMFFEERLRSAMMSVPMRVRRFLRSKHAVARH